MICVKSTVLNLTSPALEGEESSQMDEMGRADCGLYRKKHHFFLLTLHSSQEFQNETTMCGD
jgi:hypothetical protein